MKTCDTNMRDVFEPVGEKNDGSENGDIEEREDENPLAWTNQLHQ